MKGKLPPEDIFLWKREMRDVKSLPQPKPEKEEPKVTSKTKPILPSKKPASQVILSVSPQVLGRREFRRFKIEARLDLHGMRLEAGRDALEGFLRQAQDKGLKTVLVITGKGSMSSENTLRHQLPKWFEEAPLRGCVYSFHYPAKPQDGGQGAYYVILRRGKKNISVKI